MPPEAMISIRALAKHYGPVHVVDGLDLNVRRGLSPIGTWVTPRLQLTAVYHAPHTPAQRPGNSRGARKGAERRLR